MGAVGEGGLRLRRDPRYPWDLPEAEPGDPPFPGEPPFGTRLPPLVFPHVGGHFRTFRRARKKGFRGTGRESSTQKARTDLEKWRN